MRVTIKDVAKLAGVAPSTVTRVIQNKSTISEATKERVRSAMKELDYHPNLNARSLVSQSSQVIALVLPDESDVFFQNPFFPTVLRGISQVASDYGYAIQICTGANETHRLDQLKQMIYGKRVDGLIFLYSKLNDPLVDFCIQDKFPFLILGKATSPFVSLVDNDNVKAAFDATEYFIKKGYQHIAFVGGNKELAVSQDRYKGYQEALANHQIPLREELVKFSFGFLLEENSYQIMDTLTTDILVAEGVRRYLRDKEVDLPIISFDSIQPRIPIDAYIDINTVELGRESVRTLLQIIKDNKENKTVCYRQLIEHSIIEL